MTSTTRAKLSEPVRRVALSAASCLLSAALAAPGVYGSAAAGRVQVWLEGRGAVPGTAIKVRVVEVGLVGPAGEAVHLQPRPGSLLASELVQRQVALASGSVPAGPYEGLQLVLELLRDAPGIPQGESGRARAPLVVELRGPFRVESSEALTLVVSWNLGHALDDEGDLRPGAFALARGPDTVRRLTLYVSDPEGGRVVAVNRETMRVFAEIPVGRGARGMDATPDGRSVFVAVGMEDALVRLDPSAQRVEDRLPLQAGCRPVDVAVMLGGERLVVSCAGSRVLAVVDARTNAHLGDVGLGWGPEWLAASRDGRLAYALLPEGNQVVRLDVSRVSLAGSPAVVETAPADLAVDRVEGRLFLAHRQTPVVTVLREDLGLERKLQVRWPGHGIAAEEDGRRLFLSGGEAGGVSLVAVELGSSVREWVCPAAYRLALDPDGRKLYAAGGQRGRLLVLDRIAGRLLEEIEIGRSAADVVVVP